MRLWCCCDVLLWWWWCDDAVLCWWPVKQRKKWSQQFQSFLLNGISFVVRGGGGRRRFLCTYSTVVLTDLLYMCRCAVNKTPGRPRAQEGTRTTGNTRALTHGHLKAVRWGAKNTHLLLRSKHIAPKPRIARAPELVISCFCRRLLTTTEAQNWQRRGCAAPRSTKAFFNVDVVIVSWYVEMDVVREREGCLGSMKKV